MTSRSSLSSGLFAKRPFSHDHPHNQNKRTSSLTRSSIISNTSASSSYGRPPNPHRRRSVSRPVLDAMDNTSTTTTASTTTKDNATDWAAHLQEMKSREKQANERASLAQLECQELKNKMTDLKSSHQRQVQILVDELERYKSSHQPTSFATADASTIMANELDKVKQERDQLVATVDQLTLEHGDQWKEWQERLAKKTEHTKTLEDQVAEMQQKVDMLEQQLNTKEDQRREWEQQRKHLDKQLDAKDDQIYQLTSQLEQRHQDQSSATQQLIATKDDRIKSLTANLHDTTTTVRTLEQQLVAKDNRHAEQQRGLEDQLDAKTQENADLMARLDAMNDGKHTIMDLQQQLDTANTLVDKKEQVIRDLEDQLDDKYKTTAELEQRTQEQRAAVDRQLLEKDERIHQLTAQLERHDRDSSTATQQLITTKNDRIKTLTTQLHDATTAAHALEQQLTAKDDRLESLQRQLDNKKHEITGLMNRLDKEVGVISDDKNTILDLQQQLDTVTTMVDKKEQLIRELEDQLDDRYKAASDLEQQHRAELEAVQQERDATVANLRDTMARQQNDSDKKGSFRVQQLERDLQQQDDTVAALREEVRSLKKEQHRLLQLQQEQDELTGHLTDLKQKLADKTARVYELESTVLALDKQMEAIKAEAAHTSGMLNSAKRRESIHIKDQQLAMDSLQQERDRLADTVADLRGTLARHQQQQDDDGKKQAAVIQQLERDLQQQDDVVASLRSEVRPLKKELEAKQHQLLQMTREIEALTNRLADRDDKVTRLQHDRDQRTSMEATKDEKISELERAMSNIALEMTNMSRTLSQYDTERLDLQHQIARLDKDRQRLQRQVSEVQLDLERQVSATQRQQDQYDKLQRDHVGVLNELDERTTYAHNLEERAHHMAMENDRLQGIAGTMEKRSQQISDLEASVQAVNRQLTIALEERQALEIRHADLMKLLDHAKESAGSLFYA